MIFVNSLRHYLETCLVLLVFAMCVGSGIDTIANAQMPRKTTESNQAWTQWGGPNRNFTVENVTLADTWPDEGPRQLWKKTLGEGYSSIAVSDGRLFTMMRQDDREIVVALEADSGKTIWEFAYESKFPASMRQYGPGPHATPMVCGDLVITIGINLDIYALNKETGKVIWKHDMVAEYGAKVPFRGYAPSPVAAGDFVIFATDMPPVGSSLSNSKPTINHALVAFRISDGGLAWTGLEGVTAYSSPVVTEMAGTQQVILLMRKFVAAVDPADGNELWRVPVTDAHNVATPLCTDSDQVFVTAAYASGGRLISVERNGENTQLKAIEQWFSRDIRFDQGNAIWIDQCLYSTTGDSGRAFLTCIDATTGKSIWRKRGYRRSTIVHADQKLIVLQEDGTLQLLVVSKDGPTVLASHKISLEKKPMWTPPTLVGSTLFVRNRTQIMAFSLGKD